MNRRNVRSKPCNKKNGSLASILMEMERAFVEGGNILGGQENNVNIRKQTKAQVGMFCLSYTKEGFNLQLDYISLNKTNFESHPYVPSK